VKLRSIALTIATSCVVAACSGGGSTGALADKSARSPECLYTAKNNTCTHPTPPPPPEWPFFPNAIADGNFVNAEANSANGAPSGRAFQFDQPGWWYGCAYDETAKTPVSPPPNMLQMNTAQYPSVPGLNGLEPWSAQIGSMSQEATGANGDHILYGICFDFTVPTGGYLSYWAKEITTEQIQEADATNPPGQNMTGYQAAAIFPSLSATGNLTSAQPAQWLYKIQENSGPQDGDESINPTYGGNPTSGWTNYGFDLSTKFAGQNVTLFLGVESPGLLGTSGSLAQLIAGVSVTQAHNMNFNPVDQLAATNGYSVDLIDQNASETNPNENYEATVVGTSGNTPEVIARAGGSAAHDYVYLTSAPSWVSPTIGQQETAGETAYPPEVVVDVGTASAVGNQTATMTGPVATTTSPGDNAPALIGTMGETYQGFKKAGGDLVVAHGQLYVDAPCTQLLSRCHGIHYTHRNYAPNPQFPSYTYNGYIQINGVIYR